MTAPDATSAALLVSRDLFFTSKVTGTAEMLGFDVQVVADAKAAAERVAAAPYACIFIDLADLEFDVAGFFARLSAEGRPPVVAFGSHVATARLQAARDAGCDDVLPRSRFSARLPDLLRKYCGRAGA
ncbi:MAG: response regulator [Deltaproteobacteria bacterium]